MNRQITLAARPEGFPKDTDFKLVEAPLPKADKTLKCAECSTMNFPTEWYCEQCGAELASL